MSNKLYGFKEHPMDYAFCNPNKSALRRKIVSMKYRRPGTVKRRIINKSDVPVNGERVVTVTQPQYDAYNIILVYLETNREGKDYVTLDTCEKVFNKATIKALIKKRLLFHTYDDKIKLYKVQPSDNDILSEGGVGKIVINIGV